MRQRAFVVVGVVTLLAFATLSAGEAWARASSGGSRGSRSFSAPSRPAPATPTTPASPSRSVTSPTSPAARPFGGFGSMLGGLLLGGLIGGLLFGHAGFGIGLMDVLLIAGGVMLLVSFLRRRQASPQLAMAGSGGDAGASGWGTAASTVEAPAGGDVERGVSHIRSMDASFDPDALTTIARGVFAEVQRAIGMRDVGPVRDKLAPEMYDVFRTQCDRLRSARQSNRIEQIDVRRAEVSEAWQEGGRDFVTVYLTGTLLDYTQDDTTGAVVDGSRTAPQEFEEYWTFTRPVGPNRWKLSAIQTG